MLRFQCLAVQPLLRDRLPCDDLVAHGADLVVAEHLFEQIFFPP